MLQRTALCFVLAALLAACAPPAAGHNQITPTEAPASPTLIHTPTPSPTLAAWPQRAATGIPAPTFPPLTLPAPTQMTPAAPQSFAVPADDPTVQKAVADLAARLGIAPDAITVLSVEAVTWPDSSMGCPQPGMVYLQVLVEGLRIHLSAEGTLYEYHSGWDLDPFLCQLGPRGLGAPIFVPTAGPYPFPPPEEGTDR